MCFAAVSFQPSAFSFGPAAPSLTSTRGGLVRVSGASRQYLTAPGIERTDHISDRDIVDLNIPTGIPLVYELDAQLKPIRNYYLGDAEAAAAAAAAVANEGKGQ